MAKDKKTTLKRNLDEWHDVGNGIVRNNEGFEGQLSRIVVDPLYDTSNQNDIYDFRKDTKSPLVKSYGSMVVEKKKDQDKNKKEKDPNTYMDVVTQHIPHRLSQAPQLTYPESLYTLDRSLEGYETAYNKCGPMIVNDNMIGYNRNGEAKVWVNQNYADNHPQQRLPNLQRTEDRELLDPKNKNVNFTHDDEAAMVENIVNVVGDHSEEGQWREPFRHEVRGLGFREARNLIKENAVRSNVLMPDRVDLYNHKIRGYRTQHTTTTTKPEIITTTNTFVQPPVLSRPPPPPVATTTTHHQRLQGYRFNYLPVDEPYHPDVFASRVGEHGVYHGHRY